jgi:hypothetical protein
MQLPQDATEDLAVVAPGLATPAVGGQQRLHSDEDLVGELEHRGCSWPMASKSATLSAYTTTSSKVRL